MASGSEAHARDAELAALSGEKLVDLLRTTHRRTDFEAVARVLRARDRRYAEVKAALSDINALRKKYDALLDSRRRPRDEAEELAPLIGISSTDPVHRDEPRVEDVPLSRPLKRLKQCETSALESGKRDGHGQSNSAGTLVNCGQKSSSAKSVHSVGAEDVPPSRPLERLKQCETSPLESGKRDGQGRSNSVGTLVNYGQKSPSAKSVHSVGPEDVPPSRPLERLRQCETSALKSGKMDGQGQRNSVGTLGNFGQKSSSGKSVPSVGPKGRIGQLVASSTPKDSKQGRGAVEPKKWGGGMTQTVPLLSPGRSLLPKGSSEPDHGRARTGKKQSSSDSILGPPPKWNGKTGKKQSSSDSILGPPPKWNDKTAKTSMVESSSRSANKDSGTAMSLYRQTENWTIAKGGNPIHETRMVAAPSSLSIPTLTGEELRAYCLKPERTTPASYMGIKTQKGGNGLSMKLVDVPSKEKLVGGD